MALNLEGKKMIVKEVSEVATSSIAAVVADYRGLTVSAMTDLRKKAREQGVYLRIVRNTLAKIALKDSIFACMNEALVGPTLLAFSENEPSSAARLLKDFAKENDTLSIKALSLDGQLLPGSEVNRVASLPTKDEAIAQLLSVMKAPVTKLVRTVREPVAKCVRTVSAVGESRS